MLSILLDSVRAPIRAIDRAGPHYLFLMLSGVSGLIWSPPSLKSAALIALPFYVTMGSLIVGGALCTFGRWRHIHNPKIFGLLLILISMTTYMIALLSKWPQSAVTVFFLLSFFSLLVERFLRVRKARDARADVNSGTASGSALAAYAVDSLAGRRRDPRRTSGGSEVLRSYSETEIRAARG